MPHTTFEQAKLCPKCELPGEDVSTTPARSQLTGEPVKVHMIYCRNQACAWYNTPWVVQVNSDGTVPVAGQQLGDKKYPKLDASMEERIRMSIQNQLEAEQSPGAEIRNPRGN